MILLSEIVESRVVHPLHAKMLTCLMRDVHGEFPTDAHNEVIRLLSTILMEIECILAKNKNKPITAKTKAFSTAKGAKIIVDWTNKFMSSVASAASVDSPPTAA